MIMGSVSQFRCTRMSTVGTYLAFLAGMQIKRSGSSGKGERSEAVQQLLLLLA